MKDKIPDTFAADVETIKLLIEDLEAILDFDKLDEYDLDSLEETLGQIETNSQAMLEQFERYRKQTRS